MGLGAGAFGYGGYRWWKATDFRGAAATFAKPYTSAYDAVNNARISNPSRQNIYNQQSLETLLSNVREGKVQISREDVISALQRASDYNDPSGTAINTLQSQLENGASTEEILEDLVNISRRSDSIYMHRTISSFIDDIDIVGVRSAAGLPITPTSLGFHNLTKRTPITTQQLQNRGALGASISRLEESLGGNITLTLHQRRKGSQTTGELLLDVYGSPKLPTVHTKTPQLSLRVPLSDVNNPNVIYRGPTQSSKYIAGQFWEVDQPNINEMFRVRRKMRYEEWAVEQINNELTTRLLNNRNLTRSQVRGIQSELNRKVVEPLTWVDDTPKGMHFGLDKFIAARSQTAHLYGLKGRKLTDLEYADILHTGIKGQSIFPSASPNTMAKNVVSLRDFREMDLFPSKFEWGRLPQQTIRQEYTPTGEGLQRLARDPVNRRFRWSVTDMKHPIVKTAYIPSNRAASLQKYGITPEGGGAIIRGKMPAQREIVRYTLGSKLDIQDILGDFGTEWSGLKGIYPGTVLGYDPQGKPVITDRSFQLTSATLHETEDETIMKLIGTKGISASNRFKSFGMKAMMSVQSEEQMNELRGVLPSNVDESVNAVLAMDELRKNKSALNRQVYTALYEHTQDLMNIAPVGSSLRAFTSNPANYISAIQMKPQEQILQQAFDIAMEAGLRGREMGEVFGALPYVYGKNWQNMFRKNIGSSDISAIESGTPIGYTQYHFGGLYGPGAGKTGTIEPRLFELLESPYYEGLGEDMRQDLLRRSAYARPHRLAEERILGQSLSSLLNPLSGGTPATEWTDNMFLQGGTMNIKDIGGVYIPPEESMSDLAGYKTSGGDIVYPGLGNDYRDFQQAAERYERGLITKQAMEAEIEGLAQNVHQARMQTMTGEGSIMRGPMPGSRYLTTVVGDIPEGEARITKPIAEQMFKDMEGIYGDEVVENMRKRFLAGQSVGGFLGKHPFIAANPLQYTRFKMMPGDEPIVEIGEKMLSAKIIDEAGNKIDMGDIRTGGMFGMSIDYDADNAIAMLASPDIERKAMERSLNTEYDAMSIRSQLIKPAKPSAADVTLSQLTDADEMAGAALKLRVPKERLGKLSESLQQAKAAILENQKALGHQRTMNALEIFRHLEQSSISGKHIAAGQETSMISIFEGISDSLRQRKTEKFKQLVSSVVSPQAQRFLGEGSTNVLIGGNKMMEISGLGLDQAAVDTMSSINKFSSVGEAGVSGARARQLLRAKAKNVSRREMEIALARDLSDLSSLGGVLSTIENAGTGSNLSRMAHTFKNRFMAAGGKLLEHAKPLGLGFGAAVGIATLLSSPPKSIGNVSIPKADMNSGTGGSAMANPQPPSSPPMGSPTVANLVDYPNTARVMGTSLSVSGRAPKNLDYDMINKEIAARTGITRTNTRVNDDRTTLTPQKLADLLGET